MALVRMVALYCGQGMAHLVEIYNSGTVQAVADFLVLVDFGGDKAYSADAVDYVYARLKAQSDAGRPARFDLVVISHQDGDHVVLLDPLREKIVAEALVVECAQAFLGGLHWKPGSKKIVTDFLAIFTPPVTPPWSERQRGDYAGATKPEEVRELASFSGVKFRVLVSQLAIAQGSDDVKRNASGTVLVVENGPRTIVLPGDATYHTMDYVNGLYTAWGDEDPLIPEVFAVEVPHHGALRTASENYAASWTFTDVGTRIIGTFVENLDSDIAFASAGYRSNHGHPVKEVLELFETRTMQAWEHVYVAFVFNNKAGKKKERYYEFTTREAIVTTLISIANGPVWTNIQIWIEGPGGRARISNRQTLREILESDGIEPPPMMGRRVFSPRGIRRSVSAPAPVYAPAPSEEERAAAPPPVAQ